MEPAARPKTGRPPEHGLWGLMRSRDTLACRQLDPTSPVAIENARWMAEVRADLGGDLSAAQEELLERAAVTRLLCRSCDIYIMTMRTVTTKKRTLAPIVLQRMTLVESLGRQLERLGLYRKPKDADDTLEAYLSEAGSEAQS